MTKKLATFSQEDDISIITLDYGIPPQFIVEEKTDEMIANSLADD